MNVVAPSVAIRVNDEPRHVSVGTTLHALLSELGLADRKGVAVAVNNSVVSRAQWSTRLLADGDRVLIIRASQGG